MSSTIYANLPEVLLKNVLDYVLQEDMYRLVYDSKTDNFVKRNNPNYVILNKVNQFKIDNPPIWNILNYQIWDNSNPMGYYMVLKYRFDITFPLMFRSRPGLRDDDMSNDEDRYLRLDFTHIMDGNMEEGFYTKQCSIALPEYYHCLINRKRFEDKNMRYIENHSTDLVFENNY